ncbi:peptidoglycan DD-metalloendopeptidase family protein [Sulfurimonas sp.]|uniref:murein hydrolase activator EnvC family protein n=1 Tax=Sulfurimonas sp. TaxID=2022749 RepID=UPI0026386BDE|nr:peptidoglycan DD-metalloendopeptidase family protein [Sulfurimonas sp.]MDD5156694.1 peptidoglycan DD-metalloendopeptidase family protein [Sulfurimonas sp.]
MIRLSLCLMSILLLLDAKTSIDNKIKHTSSELSSYGRSYEEINKKMEQNAIEVSKHKNEISMQQKHLTIIKDELSTKESSYEENKKRLKELKSTQDALKKNGDILEEDLVFTIAQSVSLSMILEEKYSATKESLMESEVLKIMLKNSKSKIEELNEKLQSNSKNISSLSVQTNSLEASIASIDAKRKDLVNIKAKNEESLKKLTVAESSYKRELEMLIRKQDELKRTLAQLNIIKIDEIKKAAEDAKIKEAFSAPSPSSREAKLPDVKKHGNSYASVETKKYDGEKTIPPFESYTITKSFGNYTDPIYGIKTFNESITMKSGSRDTKIQTVLNGKVIYAAKTAVLNYIVIVEHDNGLHTIYANLSQISPDIVKGKKIRQGYTIGRIEQELIFSATQKSFHLNPVNLFR